MLIGIIIGVLLMSLFSTLVCTVVSNEKILVLATGPVGWVALLMEKPLKKFFHWLRYRNRKQIVYNMREKKYYYCNSRVWFNPSILGEDWTWASSIHFEKFSKIWGKRFTNEENKLNMRYVPKKVWKNFDPLPKELLNKIFEED